MRRLLPSDVLVTTTTSPDPDIVARARTVASRLHRPFVMRRHDSLATLVRQHRIRGALVVDRNQLRVVYRGRSYSFHPNMAHHRVTAVQAGRGDRLLSISDLHPGDRFLDCTCGLGADAIVAAHAVGPDGQVDALETSALLATVVSDGMARGDHRNPALVAAMRRVVVRHATAEHVLATLPSQSWDVVYFDPMFDTPVEATTSLELVRLLATPDVPSRATLTEARRVARRCVVVKDRATGTLLEQLGLAPVGTTRRHVRYGRG